MSNIIHKSCPFQGFSPGVHKCLQGGLNWGQSIGDKIEGNSIHFENAREQREHLEGL